MKRLVWLVVVVALVHVLSLGDLVEASEETFFDKALKFVLWSAIATDRHQTYQWIGGTHEKPVRLEWPVEPMGTDSNIKFVCECVYEDNPVLAGRHDLKDAYFDWWGQAIDVVPLDEWGNVARVGLILLAIDWVKTVINNNDTHGLPLDKYMILEYRVSF